MKSILAISLLVLVGCQNNIKMNSTHTKESKNINNGSDLLAQGIYDGTLITSPDGSYFIDGRSGKLLAFSDPNGLSALSTVSLPINGLPFHIYRVKFEGKVNNMSEGALSSWQRRKYFQRFPPVGVVRNLKLISLTRPARLIPSDCTKGSGSPCSSDGMSPYKP
jgi:hypothetical protein